jgi:hypothetical protein
MSENYGMMNIGPGGTNTVGGDFNTGYQPTIIRVTTSNVSATGSEQELLRSVRQHVAADLIKREYDIFLSHATADPYARTLCHALEELGAKVWFDESCLKLGENFALAIDQGITRSRIGVILVTRTVLAGRPWVDNEFSALIDSKDKVIPILHEVTWEELRNYSLLLHLRNGLSTANRTVEEIAKLIVSALNGMTRS